MMHDDVTEYLHWLIADTSIRVVSGEIQIDEARRLVLRAVDRALASGLTHALLLEALEAGQKQAEGVLGEILADLDGTPRVNCTGGGDDN